jgi:hypothetical protein
MLTLTTEHIAGLLHKDFLLVRRAHRIGAGPGSGLPGCGGTVGIAAVIDPNGGPLRSDRKVTAAVVLIGISGGGRREA